MIQDVSNDEESISSTDKENDKKEIITFYFNRGFSYNEIVEFVTKWHNFSISLYQWGFNGQANSEDILETVRQQITEIINGPAIPDKTISNTH